MGLRFFGESADHCSKRCVQSIRFAGGCWQSRPGLSGNQQKFAIPRGGPQLSKVILERVALPAYPFPRWWCGVYPHRA